MSLWDARFKKEADKRLNDFNSSISVDHLMYAHDIKGSLAHAQMLASCGIIAQDDFLKIKEGLLSIQKDIEEKTLEIDPFAEDIHMFMETELTNRIGDAGKRLHTARSRNDQVALDARMYISDEVSVVIDELKELVNVLCEKASTHTKTIMPGYTHLQRAQPITFAHHLMAYTEMFLRDIERLQECQKRIRTLPLGSGALATTTYPIDRFMVKDLLKFDSVSMNSLDGVSDRDFCIEVASNVSMLMMHLSRFSEEIILWCSWEYKFMELDDAFATGSSIMPQKKNPDVAELIRGKTGRVYGDLQTLLVMMKGLPLAYNKDMQEDKEATFDALSTVHLCLTTFTPMLATSKVLSENMRKAAAKGFINATDCADYLVKKGMAFRDAYRVIGALVAYAQEHDKTLENLTLEEYKQAHESFEEDVFEAISLDTCVNQRGVVGGPAPEVVEAHIEHVKTILREMK
ncbi:argininosuccinate lyase [Amedibacillus sp. YH-ame6]